MLLVLLFISTAYSSSTSLSHTHALCLVLPISPFKPTKPFATVDYASNSTGNVPPCHFKAKIRDSRAPAVHFRPSGHRN